MNHGVLVEKQFHSSFAVSSSEGLSKRLMSVIPEFAIGIHVCSTWLNVLASDRTRFHGLTLNDLRQKAKFVLQTESVIG